MIQLNYRDSKPIYEQVKDGIRRLVIGGGLQPGDKLPSVRELAAKLTINPNTIARAYQELEQEGYVRSENGKGTYVENGCQAKEHRLDELLARFDDVVEELFYLSVAEDALEDRVRRIDGRRKAND